MRSFTVCSPLSLANGAFEAIDAASQLALSAASVWELEIKRGLGTLERRGLKERSVDLLPLEIEDAILARSLPHHHRDPFDHMIIAQAKRRGLPIVTRDRTFKLYGVPIIWA